MSKKLKKGKSGGKGSNDPKLPSGGVGQGFVDRNLIPVNPFDQQFSPTEDSPISNNKSMAGLV